MRFFAAVALLVATMAAVQIGSIRLENQTWDEAIYLAAGYSYWETGDYRLNAEHPPFAKLICAVPLLFLGLRLPLEDRSWRAGDEVAFGQKFLYENRLPAPTILFAARCTTIALTIAFGLVLALWVRRRAGDWAAFCALALYAFDPNVIAHGRYTTNDLAVSAFFFLACVLWDRALRRATASDYAFAGLALGLALGTKFSAVLLLPIFVLLALARRPKPRPALLGALVSCAVAFAIVAALYRGRPGMYADGLRMVSSIGHISYLLGQDSRDGWWYYFPVAFAVKTPVALFALIAVAAFAVWRRRGVPSRLAVLVVPIAFYGVSCLFSRADIGLRYLLPIYPMLYALLAIVAGGAPRWLVALCVVAFGAESAAVYPNYLAFFNVLVGGPAQGPKYLLDSNIDWGQDLDKTKRWLQARGIDHVCMAYFGNVPAAYFGIAYSDIPTYREPKRIEQLDCMVAASATFLYGRQLIAGDSLRWLRTYPPTERVGYSIYVFDLRKTHR